MPENATIDETVLTEVARLSEAGSEMYDEGDDRGAIASWRRALELLPAPQGEWSAAVGLNAAIGDALDQLGDAAGAEAAFRAALDAREGALEPLVPYMVGVLTLERGDDVEAISHLMHAFALSGRELFDGERGERALAALNSRRTSAAEVTA